MPKYILKLNDYYLEWSTIVDAPVTFGMTLEDFTHYYRNEYGQSGIAGLSSRLARVESKGVSSHLYADANDLISFNRAGKNETCLTKEQIIDFYCDRQGEGDLPEGKPIEDCEDD